MTTWRQSQESQRKVFYFALGIILCYMLARAVIASIGNRYGLSWEQYDLWMTLPRLLGFAACFVIINRYGGLRLWGWHAESSRRGLLLLALITAGYIAHYASSMQFYHNAASALLMGWATTLAVVLFEELCFRGLVYLSLRQRCGSAKAAAISSALFMLYHWPAQPISEWPQIFAYGMVACSALELGTGLVVRTEQMIPILFRRPRESGGRGLPWPERGPSCERLSWVPAFAGMTERVGTNC